MDLLKNRPEAYKAIAPQEFEMRGKWIDNWFSNMVPDPIYIEGFIWPSVENYYQGSKTTDFSLHANFAIMTPSEAKNKGRKVNLRPNWEEIKIDVMRKALRVKFTRVNDQGKKLMATGDDTLVELNNWGDTFWGVDVRSYLGFNILGNLLMDRRAELKRELDYIKA